MKNQVRKFKLELVFTGFLFCGCMFALAQTINDVNSSLGNAELMRHNLNEPNAVNPALHNNQDYERHTQSGINTSHPETDLANSYNRSMYEKDK